MELNISGSGLSYQTGDRVAVWPTNSSNEVDRFLKVHGLIEKRNSVIAVKALEPTTKVPLPTLTTYDDDDDDDDDIYFRPVGPPEGY